MATIVQMPLSHPRGPRDAQGEGGSATILFFTGVRYVREPEFEPTEEEEAVCVHAPLISPEAVGGLACL